MQALSLERSEEKNRRTMVKAEKESYPKLLSAHGKSPPKNKNTEENMAHLNRKRLGRGLDESEKEKRTSKTCSTKRHRLKRRRRSFDSASRKEEREELGAHRAKDM